MKGKGVRGKGEGKGGREGVKGKGEGKGGEGKRI